MSFHGHMFPKFGPLECSVDHSLTSPPHKIMPGKKRSSEATVSSVEQRKRVKHSNPNNEKSSDVSLLRPEEVDFPRGGGTDFTPVEYKAIRAEALKELDEENVFKVCIWLLY